MLTRNCRNVNQGLPEVLRALQHHGRSYPSRNGEVVALNEPFCISYNTPYENVLFSPLRDANPFFHFMESVWMLAGRNDVEFVSMYNRRMREYSDDGIKFHGAYGYRWRHAFGFDQLNAIKTILKDNPFDRRAVLGMWHPGLDLGKTGKDFPCNTHCYFRIVEVNSVTNNDPSPFVERYLQMTVCNRSNDAIWGLCGANAVHFSFLHRYMAECLDVNVGELFFITNNLHVYTDQYPLNKWYDLIEDCECSAYYDEITVTNLDSVTPETITRFEISSGESLDFKRVGQGGRLPSIFKGFDREMYTFMQQPDKVQKYTSVMLQDAQNMALAWIARKRDLSLALHICKSIQLPDWRHACVAWLNRHPFKGAQNVQS